MATRAYPVAYSSKVERAAAFYRELLGFEEHHRLPRESGSPTWRTRTATPSRWR
jgi:catechol 2,3-dioxygenase-like lactoylglutathione lyase family enzyme